MIRTVLVVAAALLISLYGTANAAEDPERLSPNAQKFLATLNMAGINSKEVREFIFEANANMDQNNNLALAGGEAMGGQWSLRYDTNAPPTGKQFELRYTSSDYPLNVTARTNMIAVSYRIEFK